MKKINNDIKGLINMETRRRANLGLKGMTSKLEKSKPTRETVPDARFTDEIENVNPFLDGTLVDVPSNTKEDTDNFHEHLSVVRNAKPRVKRYIPWFKIIMFSLLSLFLAGMIIGFIALIILLT